MEVVVVYYLFLCALWQIASFVKSVPDPVFVAGIFAIAFGLLVLFLIRLRNIGRFKPLRPMATGIIAWLLCGLWELHIVLGHTALMHVPVPWPHILLIASIACLCGPDW